MAFVGYMPFCLWGMADWTCVDNVFMVVPFVAVGLVSVLHTRE